MKSRMVFSRTLILSIIILSSLSSAMRDSERRPKRNYERYRDYREDDTNYPNKRSYYVQKTDGRTDMCGSHSSRYPEKRSSSHRYFNDCSLRGHNNNNAERYDYRKQKDNIQRSHDEKPTIKEVQDGSEIDKHLRGLPPMKWPYEKLKREEKVASCFIALSGITDKVERDYTINLPLYNRISPKHIAKYVKLSRAGNNKLRVVPCLGRATTRPTYHEELNEYYNYFYIMTDKKTISLFKMQWDVKPDNDMLVPFKRIILNHMKSTDYYLDRMNRYQSWIQFQKDTIVPIMDGKVVEFNYLREIEYRNVKLRDRDPLLKLTPSSRIDLCYTLLNIVQNFRPYFQLNKAAFSQYAAIDDQYSLHLLNFQYFHEYNSRQFRKSMIKCYGKSDQLDDHVSLSCGGRTSSAILYLNNMGDQIKAEPGVGQYQPSVYIENIPMLLDHCTTETMIFHNKSLTYYPYDRPLFFNDPAARDGDRGWNTKPLFTSSKTYLNIHITDRAHHYEKKMKMSTDKFYYESLGIEKSTKNANPVGFVDGKMKKPLNIGTNPYGRNVMENEEIPAEAAHTAEGKAQAWLNPLLDQRSGNHVKRDKGKQVMDDHQHNLGIYYHHHPTMDLQFDQSMDEGRLHDIANDQMNVSGSDMEISDDENSIPMPSTILSDSSRQEIAQSNLFIDDNINVANLNSVPFVEKRNATSRENTSETNKDEQSNSNNDDTMDPYNVATESQCETSDYQRTDNLEIDTTIHRYDSSLNNELLSEEKNAGEDFHNEEILCEDSLSENDQILGEENSREILHNEEMMREVSLPEDDSVSGAVENIKVDLHNEEDTVEGIPRESQNKMSSSVIGESSNSCLKDVMSNDPCKQGNSQNIETPVEVSFNSDDFSDTRTHTPNIDQSTTQNVILDSQIRASHIEDNNENARQGERNPPINSRSDVDLDEDVTLIGGTSNHNLGRENNENTRVNRVANDTNIPPSDSQIDEDVGPNMFLYSNDHEKPLEDIDTSFTEPLDLSWINNL